MPDPEDRIARQMATQTATLAVICKLLVQRNALDQDELVKELYELLLLGSKESPQGVGPLKHLISLIER